MFNILLEWDILENQSPSEHNWGLMYSYVKHNSGPMIFNNGQG